ncbi:hypothetical protein AVEN_32865-1 [Araneus ventricosus]|uniref:Uncharacterized protein n=1 Tax=Araneus ventricosus TaxID=182803 RepID=A0A4Y2E1Y9_ARAVE|nr:hypothetical protein AVEN_32865-1 [Araneus ventricosus]
MSTTMASHPSECHHDEIRNKHVPDCRNLSKIRVSVSFPHGGRLVPHCENPRVVADDSVCILSLRYVIRSSQLEANFAALKLAGLPGSLKARDRHLDRSGQGEDSENPETHSVPSRPGFVGFGRRMQEPVARAVSKDFEEFEC